MLTGFRTIPRWFSLSGTVDILVKTIGIVKTPDRDGKSEFPEARERTSGHGSKRRRAPFAGTARGVLCARGARHLLEPCTLSELGEEAVCESQFVAVGVAARPAAPD